MIAYTSRFARLLDCLDGAELNLEAASEEMLEVLPGLPSCLDFAAELSAARRSVRHLLWIARYEQQRVEGQPRVRALVAEALTAYVEACGEIGPAAVAEAAAAVSGAIGAGPTEGGDR